MLDTHPQHDMLGSPSVGLFGSESCVTGLCDAIVSSIVHETKRNKNENGKSGFSLLSYFRDTKGADTNFSSNAFFHQIGLFRFFFDKMKDWIDSSTMAFEMLMSYDQQSPMSQHSRADP